MIKCEVPALADIIDLIVPAKGDRQARKDILCFVPGCDRKHETFGMCKKHTRQLKKARPEDFKTVKEKATTTVIHCSYEGCNRPSKARNLCTQHYQGAPKVKARSKYNERRRKIEKGIKVMSDFSIPFPPQDRSNYPTNDFLTTSHNDNHYLIKTNLKHLSVCMGNGQNLMMTKGTLNNLAEDGIIQFMLDEGNYNLGIIVSKSMELEKILLSTAKPAGILETPTTWKM